MKKVFSYKQIKHKLRLLSKVLLLLGKVFLSWIGCIRRCHFSGFLVFVRAILEELYKLVPANSKLLGTSSLVFLFALHSTVMNQFRKPLKDLIYPVCSHVGLSSLLAILRFKDLALPKLVPLLIKDLNRRKHSCKLYIRKGDILSLKEPKACISG